jgi:ABC-2 type transport system permease protein
MLTLFHQLAAAVIKEIRLILRDKEALIILFIMPMVFVLILSLALRDSFHERAGVRFALLIVNQDRGPVSVKLVEIFSQSANFKTEVVSANGPVPSTVALDADLRAGRYKFAFLIPPQTSERALRRVQQQLGLQPTGKVPEASVALTLLSDPTVRGDQRALVQAALNRALQGVESGILLQQFAAIGKRLAPYAANVPGVPALKAPKTLDAFAEVRDPDETGKPFKEQTPTSVQQNAPAWTMLAMFFLVIPLSVTLIKERQVGSLTRLQSMGAPAWVLLAGKILPYFVINQVQLVLILLEGMYLLPQLGGDRLTIGNAPEAIALVSMAASFAAISFGLLIAAFSHTPEQATTFGATSVLVLAAVGGIMVPKLVMPPAMQRLGDLSPMSWGLEGFLDIFVRGGGVAEVLPECSQLLVFAAICLSIAVWQFARRMANVS